MKDDLCVVDYIEDDEAIDASLIIEEEMMKGEQSQTKTAQKEF